MHLQTALPGAIGPDTVMTKVTNLASSRRRAYMREYMRRWRRVDRIRQKIAATRAVLQALHTASANRPKKGRSPAPRSFPASKLAELVVDYSGTADDTPSGTETVLRRE